jgi:hypothetical protein
MQHSPTSVYDSNYKYFKIHSCNFNNYEVPPKGTGVIIAGGKSAP